ncbi:MAG: hypothetical protein HYT15_01435 [Candidatus Magasanikbacteria bacterium]|nr:hypothetical protein [Candidatus Magasanikbacteria bacterium]
MDKSKKILLAAGVILAVTNINQKDSPQVKTKTHPSSYVYKFYRHGKAEGCDVVCCGLEFTVYGKM